MCIEPYISGWVSFGSSEWRPSPVPEFSHQFWLLGESLVGLPDCVKGVDRRDDLIFILQYPPVPVEHSFGLVIDARGIK